MDFKWNACWIYTQFLSITMYFLTNATSLCSREEITESQTCWLEEISWGHLGQPPTLSTTTANTRPGQSALCNQVLKKLQRWQFPLWADCSRAALSLSKRIFSKFPNPQAKTCGHWPPLNCSTLLGRWKVQYSLKLSSEAMCSRPLTILVTFHWTLPRFFNIPLELGGNLMCWPHTELGLM